jgi:hypothetical protein
VFWKPYFYGVYRDLWIKTSSANYVIRITKMAVMNVLKIASKVGYVLQQRLFLTLKKPLFCIFMGYIKIT